MEAKQANMTDDRDRDDGGRFTQEYDTNDFLDAIRENDGMASTSEVAETVGAPRRTAHYHLDKLRTDGRVSSRQVGQSLLWIAGEE